MQNWTHDYILVIDPEDRQNNDDAHPLEADLQHPVYVASSTEQAVSRVSQSVPWLVILVGNDFQDWSQPLVSRLRQQADISDLTIVALTDSASPQWDYSEANPGLDGLLVQPLSGDVLRSLVESAFARHLCHR